MRKTLLIIAWIVSDLLLFLGSYAVAYFIRVGGIMSSDFPFPPYMSVVIFTSPLWLSVLLVTRTFSITRAQTTLRNALYIFYSALVGAALFALGYYFLYGLFFSRALLALAFVFSAAAVWVWHCVYGSVLRRMLRRSPPAFPTLIIGVTREVRTLIRQLRERHHPFLPIAILTNEAVSEKEVEGVPVLGRLHKLEETLKKFGITHLIQASDAEQSMNLSSACRSHNITYILLPSVLGFVERDERIESLERQPVIAVSTPRSPFEWLFR